MMESKNFYYNISFKVDNDIEEQWKEFMRKELLPELKKSESIIDYSLNKVLYVDNTDGITFAVQISFSRLSQVQIFLGTIVSEIMAKLTERFMNKFVSFDSIMEIDNLFN